MTPDRETPEAGFGWKNEMNVFTRRNVVILGLVQIGVITFTVLAAGVSVKWQTTFRLKSFDPELLQTIFDYGWIALVIPLLWVIVAMISPQNESWPDQARSASVYGGFVLLGMLFVVSWQVVVRHWFGMLMHMH